MEAGSGNEKLDEVRNGTWKYFHSLISLGHITEISLGFLGGN